MRDLGIHRRPVQQMQHGETVMLARTPKEAADGADVVFAMVTNDDASRGRPRLVPKLAP